MGWVCMWAPKDERAEILSLFSWPADLDYTAEVLKLQKVGAIWFAAIRFTPKPGQELSSGYVSGYTPDENGAVTWCAVILTRRHNGEWCYKDMSEDMGPNRHYCRCPNSILKLLSPTTNEYAVRFREDCKRWNSRPKLKHGDRIRTPNKLQFSGFEEDTFIKTDWPRHRNVFQSVGTGSYVRLSAQDVAAAEVLK